MSTNSLSQGKMVLSNKAAKNNSDRSIVHNSVIPGVENRDNVTASGVEGFTGQMGESEANIANAREEEILREQNMKLERALSEYAQARKVLMEETTGFVNSEKNAQKAASTKQRLGPSSGIEHDLKVMKFSDNKMALITDKGIVKPMSNNTWESIKGKYGCPNNVTTSSEALGTVQQGDLWGNDNQFVGSNMVSQGCHSSTGINARVMSASDPMKASSAYAGTFFTNVGAAKNFEVQPDLSQTWDQVSASNTPLDLCASRAVDLGRTSYAVYRNGTGGVTCSIAPKGNWNQVSTGLVPGPTPQTDQVISSVDSSKYNSVSVLYDGRLVKSVIPGGRNLEEVAGYDFKKYENITTETVKNETDPTVGSRIHLESATYGGNCNGQENVPATNAAWQKYNEEVIPGCSVM